MKRKGLLACNRSMKGRVLCVSLNQHKTKDVNPQLKQHKKNKKNVHTFLVYLHFRSAVCSILSKIGLSEILTAKHTNCKQKTLVWTIFDLSYITSCHKERPAICYIFFLPSLSAINFPLPIWAVKQNHFFAIKLTCDFQFSPTQWQCGG